MAIIRQTFFQECEEQLAELETGLMAMEGGESDSETVNAVFRAVHSIKGGAGAFGLDDLVRFAHVFETTLDDVRSGRLAADAEVLRVMLRAADALADLVRAARDGGAVEEARNSALAAELAALGGGGTVGAETVEEAADADDGMDDLVFQPLQFTEMDLPELPPASDETEGAAAEDEEAAGDAFIIRFKPHADLYAKANETAILFRELQRLGDVSVELDASGLPPLAQMNPEDAYLSWTVTLLTTQGEAEIREVFEFVEGDCELQISRAGAAEETPSDAPDDVDVMALIRMAKEGAASMAAEAAAEAPPQAVQSSAPSPAPAPPPASETKPAVEPAPAAAKSEPTPAAAKAEAAGQTTIRVDLDRVDRLIDLVGELVINEAMLSQRVMEAGLARASGVAMALDELEQLTREIQDSVMAIRAQPVRSVFQRMPRLVREVSAMVNKQVRLVTEGEGTEVDKTVIERLADPLTHMIRNAIDHGLESTEKRIEAGKPAEGVVKLCALHRSGRIVIEVADDGAGINRPRVRQIAIDKGLIPPDAVLTDEETDNLIFLPGFSTAAEISDISGRGVGMDVVRRSVQALGGRISITSRPGKGSTFTLSLPLTLAVLDGMVVTVADQTLIAPLGAIVETLQPKAADVHSLGGDARVISIRGGYVPLIDIGTALGYRARPANTAGGVALLIEGEGGARAALQVDAIQGQRQVVIKSLEHNYGRIEGIAAATVMGDGRVALILDVDAIVNVSRNEGARPEMRFAAAG